MGEHVGLFVAAAVIPFVAVMLLGHLVNVARRDLIAQDEPTKAGGLNPYAPMELTPERRALIAQMMSSQQLSYYSDDAGQQTYYSDNFGVLHTWTPTDDEFERDADFEQLHWPPERGGW